MRPELSARLRTLGQAPGSLSRFTSKKFLRFLISQELFLTRGPSRPIEALFTAQSGLTRELLTSKFHIDPRTSLLILPGTVYSPAFSTGSGHNKLTSQNNPLSIPPHKPYPVDIPSSQKLISDSRMESSHAPYIAVILTMHFSDMSDRPSSPDAPR